MPDFADDPRVAQLRRKPLDGSVPISPADWIGLPVPEREWLVDGWIPAGRVSGLMGQGGVGKSLIAQQLQTACALGRPWLGLPVKRCRSIGVYCEDPSDELQRRQIDAVNAYGVGLREVADGGALLWPRVGHDSRLGIIDPSGALTLTPFFAEFMSAAREHGAKLIILDNAGDLFALNQNDDVQARLAVNAVCGRLARELDATVLLLRHPSRSGMASGDGDAGSVAWTNAFRARLYLDYEPAEEGADKDKLARVLSHKKNNYGAQADDLRLRWDRGVYMPVGGGGGFVDAIDKRTREQEVDAAFLTAMDEAAAAGLALSVSKMTAAYAPKTLKTFPSAKGYRIGDLTGAMDRLLARGAIVNAPYGSPSRAKSKLVRSAGVE